MISAKWRTDGSGREEMTLALSWTGTLSAEEGWETILLIWKGIALQKRQVSSISKDKWYRKIKGKKLIGNMSEDGRGEWNEMRSWMMIFLRDRKASSITQTLYPDLCMFVSLQRVCEQLYLYPPCKPKKVRNISCIWMIDEMSVEV